MADGTVYRITGDKHGDYRDIERDIKGFRRDDDRHVVYIVLGDAGINYTQGRGDGRLKADLQHMCNSMDCEIAAIHGNHEMRPQNIETYRIEPWCGGLAYSEEMYHSLHFLRDGSIYDLNGRKCMVVGGAYSVDKQYRLDNDIPWFDDEQPDEYTKEYVESRLGLFGWDMPYMFTHTCPFRYTPREWLLREVDQSKVDTSTEEWLGKIERKLHYRGWYCGHYHGDKDVDRVHFMHRRIETFC